MMATGQATAASVGMPVERREPGQAPHRLIGRVISCNGSRAVIAANAASLHEGREPSWSIGSLIAIHTGSSRVICFVCEMTAAEAAWKDGDANIIHIKVELVGEITDQANGRPKFRRGIRSYPHLGTSAHRIRKSDLEAIYDLGDIAGVEVGKLSQDKSIAASVSMEDMLRKHFAVVGSTGVGKSCGVSILLRKAVETRPKLRVIILDPHNEFAAPFRDQAVAFDANSLELPYWLFTFEEFAEVVFRGRKPAEGEVEFLREAIVQAKAMFTPRNPQAGGSILKRSLRPDAAGASADVPVPYRIGDIYALIEEHVGHLEPKYSRADLRSLKVRLESLCNDFRYRFMFGRNSLDDSLETVVTQIFRVPERRQPITVLQLAGIPSDVVNSVVSVIARLAFDIAMLSGGRYEILLACEEAHRYVPEDEKKGFGPTRRSIARIAKEGRKYGCYLAIITQRPGELDPTIFSQCNSVFAMRLANERDQDIIRAAIPDSSAGVLGFLSSIGNREAIAFGEAIATPMRMTFADQPREVLPSTAFYEQASTGEAEGRFSMRTLVDRLRGGGLARETPETPSAGFPGGDHAPPAPALQPALQAGISPQQNLEAVVASFFEAQRTNGQR